MDLWLIATAAAGYLAKYWQTISKEGVILSQRLSADSKFANPEPSDNPLNRLTQNKILGKNVCTDRGFVSGRRYMDMNCLDVASVIDSASTTGLGSEKLQDLETYQYGNVLSMSNSPWEWVNGSLKEDDYSKILLPSLSTRGMSSFRRTTKKIGSLKAKNMYGRCIKPLNSVESCRIAQFCKKNEMEKHISFSSPPSTPTTLPNFICEEIQFNRKNTDFLGRLMGLKHNQRQKEVYLKKNQHVYGVPQLPKVWSSETLKKKNISRKGRQDGNTCRHGKIVHSKCVIKDDGLLDGSILFCFGISLGIMYSLVSNKKEVDKLKEALKKTEDLVQDLQEELEMKDSLTVKELSDEYCESRDRCGNSFTEKTLNAFSSKQNFYKSCDQNAEESIDSMNEIEAEFEAEIERLRLGINTYSNDARFSDLEVDPEFLSDFAEGELMIEIQREQIFHRTKPNRDINYCTTSTGNYAVSPQELSLRLHEVIQSRLELRVNELEIALQNSKRKESKTLRSPSSNTENSPLPKEDFNLKTRPRIMNLSGEALDAYNEACKEFTKMDDPEQDHSGLDIRPRNEQSHTESDHAVTYPIDTEQCSLQPDPENEKVSNFDGQNNQNENGDENDELEKELIKKIVEKAKKGSPAILNAQRWLFSLDEEES